MGYKELIEALRREGDEKARAILQEAEAEAEKIIVAAAERIKRMQEEYNLMQVSTINDQTDPILSEAEQKADATRLAAEKDISVRLYHLAVSILNNLRDEGYPDVFRLLVKELPSCKWEIVKVNPQDEKIAREYLPDSGIIIDSSITGGLEVQVKAGKIRIANTFEKRLERAWIEVLPGLMRDIYGNLTGD
ncbi:MAG: V-type ATP synthase subunit E [Thermodesulfovibrionales bacterium]|nr:V-type ATP synthase subunit E [Thermodesulfovibrionales bacterium]